MFEGTVKTSCHSELPVGTVIRSEAMDNELGYNWMEVSLSTGVKRHVIVSDVKKLILGEDNGKL